MFPSAYEAMEAVKNLDDRIGLCNDVGRGVLDVRAMLQARDPADPLPGLAESVGYTKGTIAGLA